MLTNVVVELKQLNHENVIKYFGLCPRKEAIVLQLAAKEIRLHNSSYTIHSLRQLITTVGAVMDIDLVKKMLYQIAKGINYLHFTTHNSWGFKKC